MAIKEITYDDKVDLQLWGNVPDINKNKAENMNEIKNVVNNNAKELSISNDNQIHITTEQSSTINVQDCSNLSAKIDVYGVSSQETRSGKNFFDVSKDLISANTDYEYTHLDNGYRIKLTQATSGARYMAYPGQIHLEPGQYIFSCLLTVSGGTKSNRGRVRIYNSSGTIIYPASSNVDCSDELKYAGFNIEVATDITIAFYYVSNSDIETTENANIYCEWKNIQIEKSSDTQPTEYEKYGASPSPEFPSEIENVEGDIDITIENEDKSQTQTIIFPLQEGQKLYEGSYLAGDGIHHKRKQIELDGTENWFIGSITSLRYPIRLELQDIKLKTTNLITEILSNCFLPDGSSEYSTGYENKFTFRQANGSRNLWFFIPKNFFTTTTSTKILEEWKVYLSAQKIAGTPVTTEYPLAEEVIEPYTEEQQEAYNQLQNVTPYKLVTNISTDKAKLQFNYIVDTKTYIDNKVNNMQNQLNTINELLSTANTSAMLLDNLQTDLESEVL